MRTREMSPEVTRTLQGLSYGARADRHTNVAAKALLQTMERKKSNLCVSVDVSKKDNFLKVIDAVGPYACLIKAFVSAIFLVMTVLADLEIRNYDDNLKDSYRYHRGLRR